MGLGLGAPSRAEATDRLTSLGPPRSPPSPWGPASDGRWRWAVDAEAWEPRFGATGAEFHFLLSLLPSGERSAVLKYPNVRDKKHCLLGRLLARRACARALGESGLSGFEIGRTKGGKPFLKQPLPPYLPNFNFNVSHDGRWVVLASEPLRLVGADVSAPQRWRGDVEDDTWLDDLRNLLFDKEQAYIEREETVRERYAVFQRIWSAKEAITKAIGEGLDFGLGRIEVTLDGGDPVSNWWEGLWGQSPTQQPAQQPPEAQPQQQPQQQPQPQQPQQQPLQLAAGPSAEVVIDMWPRPEWELRQELLPDGHWVTVAIGPVEEAVDANGEFVGTFRLPGAGAGPSASGGSPPPRFELLPVEALVPAADVQAFEALRAETSSLASIGVGDPPAG